jgi:hypothetical protein
MASSSKRFSDSVEVEAMKKMCFAKGTDYQTTYAKRLFTDFITREQYVLQPQAATFKNTLDNAIEDFLLKVRKEDGSPYSTSTFTSLLYSLARYIMDEYAVDIIHDTTFIKTKISKKTVKGYLKKMGKGHVEHTQVISNADMEKIATLPITSPLNLQLKTWFFFHYHLALRGNENCHEWKKEDILIKYDNGRKFIELRDMLTKNHRGETNNKSSEGRMYESQEQNCPVKCVETYLSKLNRDNEFLWQRPKQVYHQEPSWFGNQKVGVNQMKVFMKKISEIAQLSRLYTNHTPRATCITLLGQYYPDSDVASHSGHKSITAMSIYKRTSNSVKSNISSTLSTYLSPKKASSENEDIHNDCCISFGSNEAMLQQDHHTQLIQDASTPSITHTNAVHEPSIMQQVVNLDKQNELTLANDIPSIQQIEEFLRNEQQGLSAATSAPSANAMNNGNFVIPTPYNNHAPVYQFFGNVSNCTFGSH